jgi:hypothetical protein
VREIFKAVSGTGQGQVDRDTIFDSPLSFILHPLVPSSGIRNCISF